MFFLYVASPGWDSEAFRANRVYRIKGQFTDLPIDKVPALKSLIRKFRHDTIKAGGCQATVYRIVLACLPNPWPAHPQN